MNDPVTYKIERLIGIHSRDGYETAALLTPSDLEAIRDKVADATARAEKAEAEVERLREALVSQANRLFGFREGMAFDPGSPSDEALRLWEDSVRGALAPPQDPDPSPDTPA